jgi:PAS domain-containing protein
MYVSPLIDATGKQTGWMTSMTDITEPNRIREQLASSHERFTIVLEALDASVSVAPLGSQELLFANKLYRLWFGQNTEGHLRLVQEAGAYSGEQASEDVDDLAGLPTESLTIASTGNTEIFLPDLGKWLEVRSRYINWADGRLAQMVIASDITPRRQAEELAEQQAERAQNASRLITMGEMASSVQQLLQRHDFTHQDTASQSRRPVGGTRQNGPSGPKSRTDHFAHPQFCETQRAQPHAV